MKNIIFFFLLIVSVFSIPRQTYALTSDWQKDDAVQIRLITGVDGVGQEEAIPLGLEIELAPGWHTYWRSPGAAGLPPHLDWKNSMTDDGNVKETTLLYPAPKRYTAYGLETIGYRDHVVLPIQAKVRTPGRPLVLNTSVDLLICSAICVPKNYTLALTIPAGSATESAESFLIKQFHDQLPGDAIQSGLLLKSLINDGQSLTINIESRNTLQAPDIFIEDEKNISFAAPSTQIDADKHSVKFRVKVADTLSEGLTLAGMPLTVTVIDGDHALEQHVVGPPITEAPPSITAKPLSLGLAILFAILGGLILNLMPCVLPVLSLKILGVVSHGGGETRVVRHSFFITAAGILFSFLVLAVITIGLKEFGTALGWGVQFQQPVFLGCLIIILTLFAANMWGLFEIQLPMWFADNLSDASYHPKLAGDFAIGAFATLLATPCTAPFLGTAVGFALASGPLDILIIFAALGLGMVVPYLAIALFPRIATLFPKPGKWMVWLRYFLGCALAFTALWLIWVLSAQITPRFAILVGLSMLGIVILLSLRKTTLSQRLVRIGLLDFALVTLGLIISGSIMPKVPANVDALWLPFNENAIAADVEEGKVVFVDVTADWCLTCKANKKFILSQNEISQRLFHSSIIAMQADWTNPDSRIGMFLQKYGRYGIPFNAVFGPGAPQGLILPELLTPQSIKEALDKASNLAPP